MAMSKQLPFFKFHCDEYLTGDVTLLDWDLQGLFIHICAYYWKRDCSLTIGKLKQRYSIATDKQWHTLIEVAKIIKVDENGTVNITFLDEQRLEREQDIAQKSSWGKDGALKRWASDRSPMGNPSNQNGDAMIQPMAENSRIRIKNKIKNKIIYSEEVLNLFQSIVILFDESLRPKTEEQKNAWLDTLEKCIRIDNYTPELIQQIVKKARQDDFWRTNFLSVIKLRKTDKQGVKYIDVFNARFFGRSDYRRSKAEGVLAVTNEVLEIINQQAKHE